MKVVKCKNGHFYDADTYSTCPHCGTNELCTDVSGQAQIHQRGHFFNSIFHKRKDKAAATISMSITEAAPLPAPQPAPQDHPNTDKNGPFIIDSAPVVSDKNGKTKDIWDSSSQEIAQPNRDPADASSSAASTSVSASESTPSDSGTSTSKSAADASSLQRALVHASASSTEKTISFFENVSGQCTTAIDPVVGWLVCLKGPQLGASFSLHTGKNTLGRSNENDVVLNQDSYVSRSSHSILIYEPKKREFFIQPGSSSGLTYYNDTFITETCRMEDRSILTLGSTELMLVPLCGPSFSWEDKLEDSKNIPEGT